MPSVWGLVLLGVLPAAALVAASCDLTRYQIPNWLTGGLALAFPAVALAAGMSLGSIGIGLGLGAAMLTVTFVLFSLGWFGGGDAKLLAALACWVGLEQILPFLLLVAVLGGALALALLVFRALPPVSWSASAAWIGALQDKNEGVPYGIALAAAAMVVYADTPVWQSLVGTA